MNRHNYKKKKDPIGFLFAWKGIISLFTQERNAQIHLIATLGTIILGFWVKLSNNEWIILILTIASVLVAEGFNTSIERLADAVSEKEHPLIKKAKDVAAGAVLIVAFASIIIGFLLFLPKLYEKLILS